MTALGTTYLAAEPSGQLRRVLASNPNCPGLMQMHYYTDPNTGSYSVEAAAGQNVALASGNNLSYQNGAEYYSNASQKSFPYPKIVLAGGPLVSGLDGTLYPYQYQ
jgi:hypothetical protein